MSADQSNEPVDLMAELEKSLEPSGTCVIHGDYWTDRCKRCELDQGAVPRPLNKRFTATVVCPNCGTKYVAPPSEIPRRCSCGRRFWTPVKRDERHR